MRILHYSLGFPPYRTGGLTKYCMDLMSEQLVNGDEVALLWPGKIGVINKRLSIQRKRMVNGIGNYELINPLPVPLDEGISNPKIFCRSVDDKIFRDFLLEIKPDVIHIHSLMGLYTEFVQVARELNIRLVFTTHDYFGICPKVNLFRNGQVCEDDDNCSKCVECNQFSLSQFKIIMIQSHLYTKFKNTSLIKRLRAKHRDDFFECVNVVCKVEKSDEYRQSKVRDYQMLREYYFEILQMMDIVHFNSELTSSVYKQYMSFENGIVMSISHKDILRVAKIKAFGEILRISYLGPAKDYKGFLVLIDAMDKLWENGNRKFRLEIHAKTNIERSYLSKFDGYVYDELKDIMNRTDLMIAPSLCYETFGFTVLEALCFGVPVLVSNNVGAKKLLEGKDIGIIWNIEEDLADVIDRIDQDTLSGMNRKIFTQFDVITFESFVRENRESLYLA